MNFVDRYEKWLLTKGILNKRTGVPATPMSRASCKSKLAQIKYILSEMGYLKYVKKSSKKEGYKCLVASDYYPDIKKIKTLSIPEIEQYFETNYPDLTSREQKTKKLNQVFAVWKFGEFLTYELSYWTPAKLEKLKKRVYPPSVKSHEVDTIHPEKVDKFLIWLKEVDFKTYAMLYISRWIGGMRHGAVIRIKKNFTGTGGENGTFKFNFKDDFATIYGKGQGGWNKPRKVTVTNEVKKRLKEILKWRKNLKNNGSEWLFVNINGERHSDSVTYINQHLKDLGKKSKIFEKEEIELLRFHSVGRHTFGTYYYGKIPDKFLKEEMGHEDIKTTLGYAQTQHMKNRADIFKNAAEDPDQVNTPPDTNVKTGNTSIDNAIDIIKSLGNGTKQQYLKSLPENLRLQILSKLLGVE